MSSLPVFTILIPGHPAVSSTFCVRQGIASWLCHYPILSASIDSSSEPREHFQKVILFLTGVDPLPEGYGLCLFICCAPKSPLRADSYEYVGCVTNSTPSASITIPVDTLSRVTVSGGGYQSFITFGLCIESADTITGFEAAVATPSQTAHLHAISSVAADITRSFTNFLQEAKGCPESAGSSRRRLLEEETFRFGVEVMTGSAEDNFESLLVFPAAWVNRWRRAAEQRIRMDDSYLAEPPQLL